MQQKRPTFGSKKSIEKEYKSNLEPKLVCSKPKIHDYQVQKSLWQAKREIYLLGRKKKNSTKRSTKIQYLLEAIRSYELWLIQSDKMHIQMPNEELNVFCQMNNKSSERNL